MGVLKELMDNNEAHFADAGKLPALDNIVQMQHVLPRDVLAFYVSC